jgi:hypothetical protein
MNEQEARLILQAYRPGAQDQGDPHFAEALQEAARNPQLARWFAEEQAFDQAMAAHLAAVPTPFGLKTRILSGAPLPVESRPWSWAIKLAAVVALLFFLVQVVSLFRASAPASAGVQDYAREMVDFIQRGPPLDMESDNLVAIKNWLARKEASPVEIPPGLAALAPVGCRVLSFRGHEVTLICFHREGDQIAHLFVVDRAVLPKLRPGAPPFFHRDGEWTTATWAEGDRVYMIAAHGDRAAVQKYLPDA